MLGIITIYFAKNNVFFVLSCANNGDLILSLSVVKLGFNNFKKNLNQILYILSYKIKQTNFKFFILNIKGLNKFRNILIKRFIKQNIEIIKVIETNLNSYNGCRQSNVRRI